MDLTETRLQTLCLVILTVIVCGAVLNLLQIVFMPFVLAVMIALGLSALVAVLVGRLHLPLTLALTATLLLTCLLFWLAGLLVVNAAEQMVNSAGLYEHQLHDLARGLFRILRFDRFGLNADQLVRPLQHIPIQPMILAVGSSILDIVSLSLMVFLYVSYLLVVFVRPRNDIPLWRDIVARVRSFLLAKTLISVVTGLLIGVTLWGCGIQFAVVFGLFAGLLNFIPYLGPLVASLAPWPIVLLSPDLPIAPLLIALFVPGTLFFIVGNFIEPKWLGKSVQLHPLAVLVALIFWGVLWGTLGILLATPLTGILALLLSNLPATRPLARLLAGTTAQDRAAGP
jgi:AI-2 transport protein TqsA